MDPYDYGVMFEMAEDDGDVAIIYEVEVHADRVCAWPRCHVRGSGLMWDRRNEPPETHANLATFCRERRLTYSRALEKWARATYFARKSWVTQWASAHGWALAPTAQ